MPQSDRSRSRRLKPFRLLALGLITLAPLVACNKETPKSTRWDQAASSAASAAAQKAEKKDTPPAPSEKPKEAASFNKFFPADGVDGTKRAFTQEKDTYAEAKITNNGKEMVVLSISDAVATPDVKDKFAKATEKLNGYPLVAVGKNQSALLVKDRYQVKASSQVLDHVARKSWLTKFDLNGLAAL